MKNKNGYFGKHISNIMINAVRLSKFLISIQRRKESRSYDEKENNNVIGATG